LTDPERAGRPIAPPGVAMAPGNSQGLSGADRRLRIPRIPNLDTRVQACLNGGVHFQMPSAQLHTCRAALLRQANVGSPGSSAGWAVSRVGGFCARNRRVRPAFPIERKSKLIRAVALRHFLQIAGSALIRRRTPAFRHVWIGVCARRGDDI